MKRGRIDRNRDRFRKIVSTDSFTETSVVLNSTATEVKSPTTISYATFREEAVSRVEVQGATDRIPWHESWAGKFETRRSGGTVTKMPASRNQPPPSNNEAPFPNATSTWRRIVYASLIIAVVAFWHGKSVDRRYETFLPAEWHWDHNIYMPNVGGSSGTSDSGATLIAQVVPGTALSCLGDISMRPNRAYARQWGVDFVRYDSGHSSYDPRACFAKVAVLNEILDRQSNNTNDGRFSWQHDLNVGYESILLLPADAILMELDTNILGSILPPGDDKLVAIAGWNNHEGLNSNSDILLFNLKHRHTEAVARLWLDMVGSMKMTCGDNNDLGMLVTAIAMVVDGTEKLSHFIQPLEESDDGFVGDRFIKTISIEVPEPRTAFLHDSLQKSAVSLQGTADAVCFRFFPKCEVLPAS